MWIIWDFGVGDAAGGAVPRFPAEGEFWDVGNSWITCWAHPPTAESNPKIEVQSSSLAQLAGSAGSVQKCCSIPC